MFQSYKIDELHLRIHHEKIDVLMGLIIMHDYLSTV